MASYTTTYTFTAGTKIKASEANANFANISSFLNDSVMHVDGSRSFTGIPTVTGGAAIAPTADNHLTRKKYVDDQDAVVAGTVTTLSGTVTTLSGTVTTNKTASDAAFKKRPSVAGDDRIMKMDEVVVTTNSSGEVTVTFAAAFPTAVESVVACNADPSTGAAVLCVTAKTKTGFTVRVYKDTSSAPFGTYFLDRHASAGVRLSYFAVGY